MSVADIRLRATVNLTTIPTIFTVNYGESIGIEGLNYISLGVGA